MPHLLLVLLIVSSINLTAQMVVVDSSDIVAQMEQSAIAGNETENEELWFQLEKWKHQRLNMNDVSKEELESLGILNWQQIESLIAHIKQTGPLISVYELQSVPLWDIATIKRLLPYITVANKMPFWSTLKQRLKDGERSWLTRYTTVLQTAEGYKSKSNGDAGYAGNKAHVFTRYKYQYGQLLQFGFTAEKDAGEAFFKKGRSKGFDFYGAHLFIRNMGCFRNLALGDFTVNFGQGLLIWQGMAFTKGSNVLAIKRQGETLKPYQSSGEYHFHRGVGVSIEKYGFAFTFFASLRKLSAGIEVDTTTGVMGVNTIRTSGYHRTLSEINGRNQLSVFTTGVALRYRWKQWQVAFHHLHSNYSLPLLKGKEWYQANDISGKQWKNSSIDYSYNWKNIHAFGELAVDKRNALAWVQGCLVSLHPKADLSVFYRNISKQYQSVYGNAFTENGMPSNERGLYVGLELRPSPGIQFSTYLDYFKFPWLKFRADGPSVGAEHMFQVLFQPSKTKSIYARAIFKQASQNNQNNEWHMGSLEKYAQTNLRMQVNIKNAGGWQYAGRVECVWRKTEGSGKSDGFLVYQDVFYKPMNKRLDIGGRLLFFNTSDFNTRIYTYEQGVLYSSAVPFYYDKGFRVFLLIGTDAEKILKKTKHSNLSVKGWLKWSNTVYPQKNTIGTGSEMIKGGNKSEINIQFLISWQQEN